MKVNLNWLADWVDLKLPQSELLENIGRHLGEIEAVENLSDKYAQALIVKVVIIRPHPQADHLKICLIDDGQTVKGLTRQSQGLIEIICGASNLREGMLAVWLPPGSVIPNSYAKDRVTLDSKTIRQVVSHGMLASLFELELGQLADEILDLSAESSASQSKLWSIPVGDQLIGRSFAEVLGLNTLVLDLENKMFSHRPDCFGLLGLAREIAAITGSRLKKPAWYNLDQDLSLTTSDEHVNLKINCPDLAPRFRAYYLRDLVVRSSPLKLRIRLATVGIKPVNHIVDLTNYVMYVSGQPTHAFDYDKLLKLSRRPTLPLNLVVRLSRQGEELSLINGKVLKFNQPALVIATDKQPVALAGIMGGSATEVDDQTKNVLLECAHFDMYQVRRTTMDYGLASEAATRFIRGQSLRQIPPVGQYLSQLVTESTQGSSESGAYEYLNSARIRPAEPVVVGLDFINQLLGSQLTLTTVRKILSAVDFEIDVLKDRRLAIKPPFWRTDLGIAEDIVEEVGRLYGYHRLAPSLPSRPVRAAAADGLLSLKTRVRACLSARGANEVMGYSFVSADFARQAGYDLNQAFHLANPLNPQLAIYRQDISASLVATVEVNQQQGYHNFALFEIGSVHRRQPTAIDDEGLPVDLPRIALVYAADNLESLNHFYVARRYLDLLGRSLGLSLECEIVTKFPPDWEQFSQAHQADNRGLIVCQGQPLGIIGICRQQPNCAGWEIDGRQLLDAFEKLPERYSYRAVSRFPKSSQDLTLRVPLQIAYGQICRSFDKVLAKYPAKQWIISHRLMSIFQPADQPDTKHLSFRITVSHYQKTVSKSEVSEIIHQLIEVAAQACQAQPIV